MSSFSKLPPIYQELKERGLLSHEEYTRCWLTQLISGHPTQICSRCFQSGHQEDDHCPFYQMPRDSYPGILCAEGLPCPYRHSLQHARPCSVCHYHECRTIEINAKSVEPCTVCHRHVCDVCPVCHQHECTTAVKTESETLVEPCKQCNRHLCKCQLSSSSSSSSSTSSVSSIPICSICHRCFCHCQSTVSSSSTSTSSGSSVINKL
jgi:hypothetical protein